jgi:hypothetical protein
MGVYPLGELVSVALVAASLRDDATKVDSLAALWQQ